MKYKTELVLILPFVLGLVWFYLAPLILNSLSTNVDQLDLIVNLGWLAVAVVWFYAILYIGEDAKRIRETDAEWEPHPWVLVFLYFFIPYITVPYYVFRRRNVRSELEGDTRAW